MKGKLIVIEGLIKDSCAYYSRELVRYLREKHYKAYHTKNPARTFAGKLAKRYAKMGTTHWASIASLLFAADRIEDYEISIAPHLKHGAHVVCAGFYHSSLVHQTLSGEKFDWIWDLNSRVPVPDLTIYLRLSVPTARRIAKEDKLSFIGAEHRLVRAYDETMARLRKEGNENIVTVNVERPVEKVREETESHVLAILPPMALPPNPPSSPPPLTTPSLWKPCPA